jgi:pimeloyl-ACP methyl ester carboxylesterase
MTCSTETLEVGGTQLYLLKGGSGPAVLVLHGIEGHEGWLAFHEDLSQSHTVYAPSHPGYGHTPVPVWISNVQHQAIFYHWFLQDAGLDDVDLIGVGLGGWIAAEMAVMDASRLRHLALVNPSGIRPEQSDMVDVFVAPWRQIIERGFHNADQFQRVYANAPIQEFGGVREAGRTMSMRMCFKPYMHNPSLEGMLPKVRTPTLVVRAEDDAMLPVECAERFARSIRGAKLHVLPECGHLAHMDQPHALATVLNEFLSP